MFTFIVAMQLATSLVFVFIWGAIALLIGLRAKSKEDRPAGIWARFVCIGFDFAVIYVLFSVLAYRGSLDNSIILTVLIFYGYFFFFWLFFSATPGKMLAGMKILPKENNEPLKIHQIILRLLGYIFLIVGWFWALRKNKRALHDIFGGTKVVYSRGKVIERSKQIRIFALISFGIFFLLFVSYFIHGLGEATTQYKESEQLKLIDANADGAPDALMFDLDNNGTYELIKNDIDYDRIIDLAFYDLDDDGRVDAIDLNNDGRIDGYDFNSDSMIDEKVFSGYKYIYLWSIWSILLILSLAAILILIEILEKKENLKIFNKFKK